MSWLLKSSFPSCKEFHNLCLKLVCEYLYCFPSTAHLKWQLCHTPLCNYRRISLIVTKWERSHGMGLNLIHSFVGHSLHFFYQLISEILCVRNPVCEPKGLWLCCCFHPSVGSYLLLQEEASSDSIFPIIGGLSYGFPSYISEGFYCLWFQDYLRYAHLHSSFLSQFFFPVDHLRSSVPLSKPSHIQFPF